MASLATINQLGRRPPKELMALDAVANTSADERSWSWFNLVRLALVFKPSTNHPGTIPDRRRVDSSRLDKIKHECGEFTPALNGSSATMTRGHMWRAATSDQCTCE